MAIPKPGQERKVPSFDEVMNEPTKNVPSFDEVMGSSAKKKTSSIDYTNLDAGGGENSALTPFQSASPSQEETLIDKVRKADALSRKTAPVYNNNAGIATKEGEKDIMYYKPDEAAMQESEKIKEGIKKDGGDLEHLSKMLLDIPEEWFSREGFTKPELSKMIVDNPKYAERVIAASKWSIPLIESINKRQEQDPITDYTPFKKIISDSAKDVNYTDIRKDNQALVDMATHIENEDERKKVLDNLATERSYSYGKVATNPEMASDDPLALSGKLNQYQLAAYHYNKDLQPETKDGFDAALIDKNEIKDNPYAQIGMEERKQRLEEQGIGLAMNYAKETIDRITPWYNELVEKSKTGQLTPEEQQEGIELESTITKSNSDIEKATQAYNGFSQKYPTLGNHAVNQFAQELLGQTNTISHPFMTMGNAVDNTISGVSSMGKAPFLSDHQKDIDKLSILGQKEMQEDQAYLTQNNQLSKSFKPTVDPDLQKQIDAIKSNKDLNYEQKMQQTTRLLTSNPGKWSRTPVSQGKTNIGLSSVLYGVGDLAANLAPFMALEAATGGGATAGGIRKFASTFAAAAATGYQESLADAIKQGESNPYAHAFRVTAINSLAMAGAGTPDAIRKLAGMQKGAVKDLILKMTDSEISAALKEAPKALSSLKKVYIFGEKVAKSAVESTKEATKITAFTTAGQIANDAIDNKLQTPQDYASHGALEVLKFGLFGTVLGATARSQKPTEITKATMYEAGENPAKFLNALLEREKLGNISPTEATQVRKNIEKAEKAVANVPEGLNDVAKREYLYNEMQKNDAKEQASKLPPKQAADANKIADVAVHKNQILLDNPTEKQLEKRKVEVEQSLEPEVDESGKKKEINEKVKRDATAELQAIKEIQDNHAAMVADAAAKRLSKKEEDTKPSIPIEGTDEQGIPIGENVPPAIETKIEDSLQKSEDVNQNADKETLLTQAKDLVNKDVVQGFTADVMKDAANNDPATFESHLKDIADQANDPMSNETTVKTYGKELVDIAQQLNPEIKNENKGENIIAKEKTSPTAVESTENIQSPKEEQGVQPKGAENESGGEVALRHADTEKIYKEGELPERLETPTKHNEDLEKEADELIKKGYDFDKRADEVMKGEGKGFEDVDQVAFAKEVASLKVKQESLDVKSKEFDEMQDKIEKLSRASDVAGTIGGRFLQSRKIKVPLKESLSDFVQVEKELNRGASLTDNQKEVVKEEHTEISAAEEKWQQKVQELEAENTRLKAAQEIINTEKESRKNKNAKKDFTTERQDIKKSISDKLREARGQANVVPVPYLKELITIAPDVLKLVKSYVEEGIVKLEDVVKKIHADLKDDIPDIKESDIHDIIAGEYNAPKKTRSEIAGKVYDLRTQAKLINKLEEILKGEEPKTEQKKIRRNKEIEDLRKQIKGLQGEGKNIETATLNSIKGRTQKQIAEIEEQLKTGDFEPKKKAEPLTLDAEALALKDKLVSLKNERAKRILRRQLDNQTDTQKFMRKAGNVANVPRALMSTLDFSAVLRQGLVPTISNPKMAAEGISQMFKSAFSEKEYNRWMYDLGESQRYQMMKDSKLAVTDAVTPDLQAKEEAFMTNLVDQVPVLGKLTKGSERAYSMYLNKMRVDLFNRFADAMEERGVTMKNSPEQYKQLAKYINNSTGRGDIGGVLNDAAPLLNGLFFSPRLIASRINMLTYFAQPRFYKSVPQEVRQAYFKDMAKFIGVGMTVLALAKLSGAQVEDDPRSADFGKIKAGNTRWDIWGGFQQYARAGAQVLTGETKSSNNGKVYKLNGEGIFGKDRGSVIENMFRGKLAPVPSMAWDLIKGRNIVGDKISLSQWHSGKDDKGKNTIGLGEYASQHLLPLTMTGLADAYKDQGVKGIFTAGVPSIFGVGTQTYGEDSNKFNDEIYSVDDEKSDRFKRYTEKGVPLPTANPNQIKIKDKSTSTIKPMSDYGEEKVKAFMNEKKSVVNTELDAVNKKGYVYKDIYGEVSLAPSRHNRGRKLFLKDANADQLKSVMRQVSEIGTKKAKIKVFGKEQY